VISVVATKGEHMNINRVAVRAGGAGVLVAAVVGAVTATSTGGVGLAAEHTLHHHTATAAASAMETSATGNRVELVDPGQSRYVPRVMQATARQRERSRRLLAGVNRFCDTHTVAELKAADWRPGNAREVHPTHYFTPEIAANGINPTNPRAALVYEGKVGGVMFTGQPLPRLGSIPRAHRHAHGSTMGSGSSAEMVHVYCTNDLTVKSVREAYTPNRQLGVLADTINLRLRIRPAVMGLTPHQLREVRALVRSYTGRTAQSAARTTSGPDPVLKAMRTEIRESLMELDEAQLRSVWRLMKSY
jgi:hypothetical protein